MVRGVPSGRRVAVYPADVLASADVALQPMAGRYEEGGGERDDGDAVCFVPRFGFVDGTAYAVVTEDGDTATLLRPRPEQVPTTSVVELFPTGPAIPFNQLKLYIHFSAPMSEGYALRHVHIVSDLTGEELKAVFHPMDPELWDPDRRRLTMLFDPARIKRGLAPHREIGYPLRPGVPIRVVVDRAFCDATGAPLVSPFERRYDVVYDVRSKVDPSLWRIAAPAAGGDTPVTVRFDRPLDHALLQHCLTVTEDGGHPVDGTGQVGPGEDSWSFTPAAPWRRGAYVLVVDTILEDLAGNSAARVFDRDLSRPDDRPLDAARIAVDFAIR
jgi:hypothetical protein